MTEDQKPPEDIISNQLNELTEIEMEGYRSKIRKARNALFVVAGLLFLGEMINISVSHLDPTPLFWVIVLGEVGIFVALGFWANTRPLAAIGTGLALFIGLWVLMIIVNGNENIYKGILVRVIIISYLAGSLRDAKAWEDAQKRKL